jgi:hypothetical protein
MGHLNTFSFNNTRRVGMLDDISTGQKTNPQRLHDPTDTSRIASSQVTLSAGYCWRWAFLQHCKAQEIPTYSNTQTIEIAFITV